MAQWIRRLPTEQEIPGSSPGMGCFDLIVFLCCKTNKKLSAQPLEISIASSYSLPLYQLSYTRIS